MFDLFKLNRQTKWSTFASEDIVPSEFHQQSWNHNLLIVVFCSDIAWNAISIVELGWSFEALPSELLLPSATTLRNIWQREYSVPVDAIAKQLPSQNNVGSA
jgi:hypothetical protein